jgi:methanogenic corrinoid protein MtbC1
VTEAGHNIGQVVQLPDQDLEKMLAEDLQARVVPRGLERSSKISADQVAKPAEAVANCLRAVEDLDGPQLEGLLHQGAIVHSQPILLDKILVPVMTAIGERWKNGSLRPVHEHLASTVVRNFLASLGGAYAPHEAAPVMVVTTPVGQLHEIGALLVATSAAAEGWRVTYLGPNLPAEEITAAVTKHQARAVALSIVYPTDDPRIGQELVKLRRYLPSSAILLIGGRAAIAYQAAIEEAGGLLIKNLTDLRLQLEALRAQR